MNFNPVKFLENRGEQSALKKIIQKKIDEFEVNLSYAKIDSEKKPNESYMLKEDELIALTQAVNSLNGYMEDIENEFTLDGEILKITNEIKKYSLAVLELADIEKMKDEFNRRDMNRFREKPVDPFVIEPVASQLAHSMHMLWLNIHKLKSANFDSFISSKIKPQ